MLYFLNNFNYKTLACFKKIIIIKKISLHMCSWHIQLMLHTILHKHAAFFKVALLCIIISSILYFEAFYYLAFIVDSEKRAFHCNLLYVN